MDHARYGAGRSAKAARGMRGRRASPPLGRCMFACVVVALLPVVGPPALGKPPVTRLLGALDLSGYGPSQRPPEFSGRTATGRTVTLGGLRGRVVLLTFWTTWCSECRPEMPAFEQLHRDFVAEGLTVLGVNVRERASVIQTYATELGLTFPLVLDPKGEIQASYGVIGLPTTFLIGRDARGVALAVGPREWGGPPARAIIQALLAEPMVQRGPS